MTAPDPTAAAESSGALAELNRWLAGRDAEGRLARIWRKVKVAGHAEEVLAAAQAL